MKGLVWVLMVVCCVAAVGQTPAVDPAEALGRLAFLQGDWAGRQDFNTGWEVCLRDAVDYTAGA